MGAHVAPPEWCRLGGRESSARLNGRCLCAQASAKAAFPQDGTFNYFEVPVTKVALMQTVANSYVETIGAHSPDDVITASSRPHHGLITARAHGDHVLLLFDYRPAAVGQALLRIFVVRMSREDGAGRRRDGDHSILV